MKKIFFVSVFTLCLQAQQLPTSWYSESINTKELSSEEKSQNLKSLGTYLNNILNIQENVLEKSEESFNKSASNWKLSGQKTDLAVSKSGFLGYAALKATAAVEISWSKKSSSKGLEDSTKSDIELDSSMNEKEVLNAIRPVHKLILKNVPKEKYAKQAKRFEKHILRYHSALKGVSSLETRKYTPSKFRLDMSVSYSSPLFGISRLSGDTRLRLEWKITPTKNKHHGLKKNQKVVRKILEDVEKALKNVKVDNGYKLDNLSIGLGLSKKNLLSFSKVKGTIIGHLYLKRNRKKNDETNPSTYPITGEDTYTWITEENEKFLRLTKRSKFRNGIKKSFKVANWFSRQFRRRNSKWEIKKFKPNFTLSYSGFLGLSKTSGISTVSFTYKK